MDRWQQIKRVFQSALERERTQRPAFLDEACAGDDALRNEVESLIGSHEQAENVIHEALSEYTVESSGRNRAAPAVGSFIGPYRLLSLLGKGGMGEVYRARDTRLGREVAIKVLASQFCSDQARLKRFEREAGAASALNHPNIVTIHEFGHVDSVYYICMEVVVGKTLRQVLRSGALPLKKALHIAAQLADGLAKAHAAGITHRDLKPENVMITKEGLVKVLDFGLAKQIAEGSEVGGATTRPGTVLGTVGYMSPEQASGREVDFRSDQFSYGAVVYEMLTGKRAFDSATAAETLTAIIREGPVPITEINATVPPFLRWIVERCLEKDPEDRFASTRDLACELQGLRERCSEDPAMLVAPDVPALRRRERLAWAAAAILLLVSLAIGLWPPAPERVPSPAVRFSIPVSQTDQITQVSVSPNGRRIAYVAGDTQGGRMIWVRELDDPSPRRLYGTGDPGGIFWSPDGEMIAFFSERQLRTVDRFGRRIRYLCDASGSTSGTWNQSGDILMDSSKGGGLYSVSVKSGARTRVTSPDASKGERHFQPQFLPDGRQFLFLAKTNQRDTTGIYVCSLDSKKSRFLLSTTSKAMFSGPSHLFFVRDGTLLSQELQPKTLQPVGQPMRLADHVSASAISGSAAFGVSTNGVLAYRSGSAFQNSKLQWFDRRGTALETSGEPAVYTQIVLAPDEKNIAVEQRNPESGSYHIWLVDTIRNATTRLTLEESSERHPVWFPDSQNLIFSSDKFGVWALFRMAIQTTDAEVVLKGNEPYHAMDVSRNNVLLFHNEGASFFTLPIDGGQRPQILLQSSFVKHAGRLSPDGRWLAYNSEDSGRNEVYVVSFPKADRKRQISTNGGVQPIWNHSGTELFYLDLQGRIMAVIVRGKQDFYWGIPEALFRTGVRLWSGMAQYAVNGKGTKFLVITPVPEGQPSPIEVIANWPELSITNPQ